MADLRLAEAKLAELSQKGESSLYPSKIKITVGMATCGRAAGAEDVMHALKESAAAAGLDLEIASVGCIGWCQQEPIVSIQYPNQVRYVYSKFTADLAREMIGIVKENGDLASGSLQKRLLGVNDDDYVISDDRTVRLGDAPADLPKLLELSYYKKQVKIVTRNSGYIDPLKIEEYVARGGYKAMVRAMGMTDEAIIQEVLDSGLKGRGGAGFPVGAKWQHTQHGPAGQKYTVCNADEGDPGAYMDRSVLECDPHSVLEGMAISGLAVGADTGIIYVRAEYPLAIRTLQVAIDQAMETGILGDNIFGSGFSFHIKIAKGAGAFVCGEVTALLNAVEGKRGDPRVRPPRLAKQGLWKKPTNINNVESFANIPPILARGGAWYASFGTEDTTGTKVFSLVGHVKNNGLIEVPMGITLREIIYELGDGLEKRRNFKAVQTGGPSGGCVPESKLDLAVDYKALKKAGTIMGSGGMVVMNDATCMVEMARYFMNFGCEESCGKCTPCREGTHQMMSVLKKITEGTANVKEVEELEDLARMVQKTSFCGLGQTISNPLLTTFMYFKEEIMEHVEKRFCRTGICTNLFELEVEYDQCTGCGLCNKVCPVDAIIGSEKKEKRKIDKDKCTKCRECLNVCPRTCIKPVPVRQEELAASGIELMDYNEDDLF